MVCVGGCDLAAVRTDVPSLGEDYAQREEHEERAGCGPAVCDVGCGFVQVALVYLAAIVRTDPGFEPPYAIPTRASSSVHQCIFWAGLTL